MLSLPRLLRKSEAWRAGFFGAAALAGIVIAFWQSLDGSAGLAARLKNPSAAAHVNGRAIARADYEAALKGIEAARRTRLSKSEKRRLLERFLDEELLLQRARSLGLFRADRAVRAAIVRSMIALILREASREDLSEEGLRDFYQENRGLFRREARLHLRRFRLSAEDWKEGAGKDWSLADLERAQAARRLDAGAAGRLDAGRLDARSGVRDDVIPLPDAPLPLSALRHYLGGALAAAAERLKVSELGGPYPSADGGRIFLRLIAREEARIPSFDEAREEVWRRWRTAQDDKALRAYLDRLREEARIEIHLDDEGR